MAARGDFVDLRHFRCVDVEGREREASGESYFLISLCGCPCVSASEFRAKN